MIALLSFALAAPLTLQEVLDGLDERMPKIAAQTAALEAAGGDALAARGAFDPTLRGKSSWYGGKYVRDHVDVAIATETVLGPSFSVGYTRGTGDVPAYAGDSETGPAGELYGGVSVPILDGLLWSKDRTSALKADVKASVAAAYLEDVGRTTRLDAATAYWTWVAAGRSLAVYRNQLSLAETRSVALGREVAEGQRARMDLLDNDRVLQERLAKVAEARRKLETSALKLSLYHRSADGRPVVPEPERLPSTWAPLDVPIEAAFEPGRRPDLDVADELVGLAELQRRANGNALLPKVEVTLAGTRPLDADRTPETIMGLKVEAPLLARAGRGDVRAARARVEQARSERDLLVDSARTEVDVARQNYIFAQEQAAATRLAAVRAQEVLVLERRRAEVGGGDLFLVLVREDNLAKDQLAEVDAELAVRVAEVRLRAALGIP